MNTIDAYYKKTVSYKHGDHHLQFKISQELFSSLAIDRGTQRLLRTFLFENIDSYTKVLDLGCGYGPIGITLKKTCPTAEVHMVDVDALALEFTKTNAQLNDVGEIKVYPSLGYDNVSSKDFDLIVSNIPAKVGEKVLRDIIKNSQYHLKKGGKVVIVVIDAIADFIKEELSTDDNIEVVFHKNWPGHHVYHYQFRSVDNKVTETKFADDVYRQQMDFFIGNRNYSFDVSFNLREFDELSYDTELLLEELEKLKIIYSKILCFNPGQGYVPFTLGKTKNPESLVVIDRDLLALETTKHNLSKFNIEPTVLHQVEFDSGERDFDLITGVISTKYNMEVYLSLLEQTFKQLKTNGMALFASSSTVITRIEDIINKEEQFKTVLRKRNKGRSVILLKKV